MAALPPDDPDRRQLHDEVHARPSALVPPPADIVYVAVLNHGIERSDEWACLRQLPGQGGLSSAALNSGFLQLSLPGATLKWERHSEFSRYTLVLPASGGPGPGLAWLRTIPGRTVAAIRLTLQVGDIAPPDAAMEAARAHFEQPPLIASLMGQGHSLVVTNFRLGGHGFEPLHVVVAAATTATRSGRSSARLLELETYRLMALRGLPVAKALAPVLGEAERALADIMAQLEGKLERDETLLDTLVRLAARVERATAEHMFRFAATRAYAAIVGQRIDELRE